MVSNAFIGKPARPTEKELAAALGPVKAVWGLLLSELARDFHLVDREWHSYSRRAGWSLRLKSGERNILYLSPGHGGFLTSFALGDRAVRAAREVKLPVRVIDAIDGAKRYAEGTAVRLQVGAPRDLAGIIQLAAIKLAN